MNIAWGTYVTDANAPLLMAKARPEPQPIDLGELPAGAVRMMMHFLRFKCRRLGLEPARFLDPVITLWLDPEAGFNGSHTRIRAEWRDE